MKERQELVEMTSTDLTIRILEEAVKIFGESPQAVLWLTGYYSALKTAAASVLAAAEPAEVAKMLLETSNQIRMGIEYCETGETPDELKPYETNPDDN